MSDNQTISDGQGILVGVQSPQPQLQSDWANVRPNQAVSQQDPVRVVDLNQPQTNGVGNARFTQEDLERVRQQEKDKLYPRIEEMSTQLRQVQEERAAEQAERQRLADEAAAARAAQEEQEMEIRDLMTKKEREWQEQFQSLNQRYETDRAIFERERSLNEAMQYRQARIEQESEYILPELRDLVRGDTPEEVDQSIEEMKARSEAIFQNMAAAQQPPVPFQARPAAMPSVPPVGPMEQLPSYEQLSPEDIKGMSMDTYKRYREQLLQATSPRQRGR